jgi:hypothetical protein
VRPLSDSKRPDLIGEYVTIIPVQEKDSALHFDMWLVFGKLARNEVGHLILATLTATPYSDEFGAEGLTYRVWQHIRPPRLLEAARLALHREAALLGLKSKVAPLKEEERERIEANDDLLGDDRSFLRGRPRRSDDEVADFAEKWLEVQNDPDRKRAVLDELSERLDKPRETVKTWKRQAVVRHFLTSGAAGRKAACEAGERLSERKGK